MTILDKIVAYKKTVVAKQKKAVPLKKILVSLDRCLPDAGFFKALRSRGPHLIAEIKKASPSAGVISKTFDYCAIARCYEAAGASCVSVLTENKFFQGRLSYFDDIREAISLPLLRKDFIIDPYQIYESKLHRADAILLITSLLNQTTLRSFLALCRLLRLDALVEIHDERDLDIALDCGARLIGINTRDLTDFSVDHEILPRLTAKIPRTCLTVWESGIKSTKELARLKALNVNAVLIGETLMRSKNPGAKAREFVDFLRR